MHPSRFTSRRFPTREQAVVVILGEMAAFFPGWRPGRNDLRAWVRELADLEAGLLRQATRNLVRSRASPWPPSVAELRAETRRLFEDRERARRRRPAPEDTPEVRVKGKAHLARVDAILAGMGLPKTGKIGQPGRGDRR